MRIIDAVAILAPLPDGCTDPMADWKVRCDRSREAANDHIRSLADALASDGIRGAIARDGALAHRDRVSAAWERCDDGFAMVRFVHGLLPIGADGYEIDSLVILDMTGPHAPYARATEIMSVTLLVECAEIKVTGSSWALATALRRLAPDLNWRWIEREIRESKVNEAAEVSP